LARIFMPFREQKSTDSEMCGVSRIMARLLNGKGQV
jgi:hypothetical protein